MKLWGNKYVVHQRLTGLSSVPLINPVSLIIRLVNPVSLICISLLLLAVTPSFSQSKGRGTLNNERKRIEERIRLSSQLLAETSYKRDKSLVELALVNQQIIDRESLIRSINQEISAINGRIQELDQIICAMEEDIEQVKEDYAHTAKVTYKTLDEDNLLLSVLSARSVADAYYKAQYYKQFSRYRKTQLERLQKSARFLTSKADELNVYIREREKLVTEKRQELNKLKSTKTDQNKLFFSLKAKESQYRKSLDNQRKSLKSLIRRIDKSYGVAASVTTTNNPTGKSFAQQRGRLVWPIRSGKGIVVGKFGITTDPFGNRISNDGIYIRAPKGEQTRAVFKGKVSGVQKVPLYGYMVILEHGIYRTVYANLSAVTVKKGDKVTSGQTIGTVRTDNRTDETVLNFMIYKIPNKFVNPLRWVKP